MSTVASLSKQRAQVVEEWVQNSLNDCFEFDDLLRGKQIDARKDAIAFCKELQGLGRKKKLISTLGYNTNDRRFSLSCKDIFCKFRLECQQSVGGFFRVHLPTVNLSHGGVDLAGDETLCSSEFKPSAKEVASNMNFQQLRKNVIEQPGKKRKFIATSQQTLAANEGFGAPSVSVMKNASAMLKLSTEELLESYNLLIPFCELLKKENPNLCYDVQKDSCGVFSRMALLFPYSNQAVINCYNVVGIDAAHIGLEKLNCTAQDLQERYGELFPDSKRYVIDQMRITVAAGRTLNNEMIIYGFCLGYGETLEDMEYFCTFLAQSNFPLNQSCMTILSDRGAAIVGAIGRVFPEALHHFCPKHLERNLSKMQMPQAVLEQYWVCQRALTGRLFRLGMDKMRTMGGKGCDCANYLDKVEGDWQLYKVLLKKNVLYEMKSDNLVEGVFAWLLEVRALKSPYMIAKDFYIKVMERTNTTKSDIEKLPLSVQLTAFAKKCYENNERASRNNMFTATVSSNSDDGKRPTGVVKVTHGSGVTCYTVSFPELQCPCRHWEQSGIPCIHAIMLLKSINTPVHSSHFYEFCHVDRLRKMFKGVELTVPYEDDVKDLAESHPEVYKLRPRISANVTSSTSCGRIASSGDGSKGGGQSVSRAKKKDRVACLYCSRTVSGTTRHDACSCNAFAQANGVLHSFTPNFDIGISNDGATQQTAAVEVSDADDMYSFLDGTVGTNV